jgi:glucose/arabinose dehydrogenase
MKRTKLGPLAAIAALLILSLQTVSAQDAEPPAFAEGIDGLTISTFATDLAFPMGMAALPDGSILVATSEPIQGYFNSTGVLRRLTEDDPAGTVLAGDLRGTLVAVAQAGDLVFTTSAEYGNEGIRILRKGETWSDPLETVGEINLHFVDFDHQSYGLAAREENGTVELYFNVGASGNYSSGETVDTDGLVEATLEDASIYRIAIDPDLNFGEPELIATGLRNASAMTFSPDGDLVIADNGIDTPDDRIVALSADEVEVIPRDELGGDPEDFGFPDSYVDYHTGETAGDRGLAPAVAFLPIEGLENEGSAGIAMAPEGFPDGLNAGVFVGFHGQYDEPGDENEENPVVYADLATGKTAELIANDNPGVGHLDSLLTIGDTLYIADLCTAPNSLGDNVNCGVIYAVTTKG